MKRILSLILTAIMVFAAAISVIPAPSSVFSDVERDRWSSENVSYVVGKGYMIGVGEGLFDPEGLTTRAMAATAIWRMAGGPETAFRDEFADVLSDEWFAGPVVWAKDAGVVLGVSDLFFDPDGNVTREQLAAMLYRYASLIDKDVSGRTPLSRFSDGAKVSAWAEDAVKWAVYADLFVGTEDDVLCPQGTATREMLAAVLSRFDDYCTLTYNEPRPATSFTRPDYPLVTGADFYVSTTGDDENDGTFESPFATWNRAAEAVRGIAKTADRGGITVAFMAGDYGAISVGLTAEDSGTAECPVTYCAYGDGDVFFNGGFEVGEDGFLPLSDEERQYFSPRFVDSIKKADISAYLTDYDPASLLVMGDDGECTLARYPNKYPDGTDHLFENVGYTTDGSHIRITSSLFKRRIAGYHKPEELFLYGYLTTGWYKDLLETGGYTVDEESGGYDFLITHPERARLGHLRYIELDGFDSAFWNKTVLINASEELDGEGEYWIDSDTGYFYVYEPSGDYHFTGGSDMVSMWATEYITFRSLNFKNSDGFMIYAGNCARGTTIDGCTFTGCAADAMVYLEGCRKGVPLDITVRNSDFSTCASQGLRISGMDFSDLFGSGTNVVVDNNFFTLTNLRVGNKGALKIQTSGPKVTHNHFKKCFWEGIDFRGAVNMIAEYNILDQICYNGDDTGAMNNWNSVDRCGNVVRYNLFMNIKGGTNGRYSLYLDDTAGTTVVSNLFYDVDQPAMNNGICKYNRFENNLIINPDSTVATGCATTIDATQLTERAMAAGDTSTITSSDFYTRWKTAFEYFDSHPDIKAQAAEMWPGYYDISIDLDDWQKAEFCMNSSLIITGNVEINQSGNAPEFNETIAKYSTIGDNVGFTVEENPLFVNPTAGNYAFRDGIDWFPVFDFNSIGRY